MELIQDEEREFVIYSICPERHAIAHARTSTRLNQFTRTKITNIASYAQKLSLQ